jgi:geranylgeranyl pyrophosphate synthase
VEATAALAGAAGVSGLIAGQCLDLEPPAGADIERVERIHERKTARLFAAAMEVGAILGGAGARARAEVLAAGLFAGRAFQIVDDLLDLEGSRESLGKTPRKDVNRGKPTFPAVAGREVARERAAELVESALAAFPRVRGTRLELLIRFVAGRTS